MTLNNPGFRVLLEGPTGTGKTYSIRTLVSAGITPFVLFTEPGHRTISDIPCPQLHYTYKPPATPSWKAIKNNMATINGMSFESLTKLKDGMNKREYGQFLDVAESCNDFVCDRCGEHFGSLDNWGTDRAFVIDSLSGLSIMGKDLVIGGKPIANIGEWGVAMDNLERFINAISFSAPCHFIMIAHIEREQDEVSGQIKLMTSALGRKLAPKLPRYFDDVLLATKTKRGFFWSNSDDGCDLKSRNLPLGDTLPPDFGYIVQSWLAAGNEIVETPKA